MHPSKILCCRREISIGVLVMLLQLNCEGRIGFWTELLFAAGEVGQLLVLKW